MMTMGSATMKGTVPVSPVMDVVHEIVFVPLSKLAMMRVPASR